ncbi:MAG: cytochrome C oxidase subunit II [Magnetococcales bacterium]|nr:cytochrome C oxidase subunit II [Magnetococcales bacterium]
MAITPPSEKIWWNRPLDKVEGLWILLALAWCLILFLWMPYWHIYGKQNLSNEAYRTSPDAYEAKARAWADKHKVGEENGIPVVAPQDGGDVYMLGRLWEWWPILQLKKGVTYRLHLSSLDWQHGFSLQPTNINLQVLPGYETVMKITPDQSGSFGVVCNEFCGVGHHTMLGKIYVK